MNYGTLETSDCEVNDTTKMTCFKYLFNSCCLRFRNRHPSVRSSSGRRSSRNSSEWGVENASRQSSSHVPDGFSTSAQPPQSYRALVEEEIFRTSTPQRDVEPEGNKTEDPPKSSVPLISVVDCSKDSSDEPEGAITEKFSEVVEEKDVEQMSECNSNHSDASLPLLKDETEETGAAKGASSEDSLLAKDIDVEQLPAYQSQSQLSTSTERIQDVNMADVNSASAEEENFMSVKVSGDILFGLSYNYKTETLEVDIKNCRNLSPVDVKKNRSDPYVKGYLLPDRSKSGKRKTKVKKNTLNPAFDEVLKFPVTLGELETRTLWLSVWHSQFGRNDFLGEIMLPLGHGTIENYGYKRHALNERLEKNSASLRYNGDIVLALKFSPLSPQSSESQAMLDDNTKGELHVLVKEAKNLVPAHANATSNPFCKSYLLPEKHKASKQKTSVVKKNCNPKWNHTFVYSDVTLAELKGRCLELTIWSYDKMTSNHFLGGIRLGLGERTYMGRDVDWNDCIGEEVNLWNAMLRKPGDFVEGSLLLRSQMQRIQN